MKKFLAGVLLTFVVLVGLYLVSGRGLGNFGGYMRASADSTVEHMEDQLPRDVHDRKLQNDLERMRQDLIDRKVQLTQSQSQIEQLRQDVAKLSASLARRERLLADAYPVLTKAVAEKA